MPPPSLHGAAYLDRLEEVFRELAAEAYDDPGVLLPLTGGLDSRLFAAAAPPGRGVSTLTFGSTGGSRLRPGRAGGGGARPPPLGVSAGPAYVAAYGPEAVWLLEGRLSPVGNITGSLMDRLRPATAFISGAGAAAGRHFWRSRMLVPDWAWDHAADGEFERLFTSRVMPFGLPMSSIPGLLVDGSELRAAAESERGRILASTRGRPAVDRQDLYVVQEGERFGQTGLMIADLWVQARAPLLTRRWVEAMLAGAPAERVDDLARVRLVTRLDARVAAVPWSLTRLPLPASAQVLRALRVAGRVTRRRLEPRSGGEGAAHAGRGASLLHAVQHRLYRHGDRRDDWLRGPSRSFVEDVLLSPRLADHGVFRPGCRQGARGGAHDRRVSELAARPRVAGRAVAAVVRGRRSATGRQALVMRIIVFGHNDWWVWQRQGFCTRNAALVRELAARDEVAGLVVVDSPRWGPRTHRPALGASRGGLRRRAQDPGRALRVRAAAAVHIGGRGGASTSGWRQPRLVRRLAGTSCRPRDEPTVVWVADPRLVETALRVPHDLFVFDVIDDWRRHAWAGEAIVSRGYRLGRPATPTSMFAVHPRLLELLQPDGHGEVLFNAVDAQAWADAAPSDVSARAARTARGLRRHDPASRGCSSPGCHHPSAARRRASC